MLTLKSLFHSMNGSSQNYEILHTIFHKFCVTLNNYSTEEDCPVKEYSVEAVLPEADYFDILFIGQRWRFVLSTITDNDSIASGAVNLYRLPATPDSSAIKVSTFTFKGNAVTDVVPPDNDGDPVTMLSPPGALYLAMNCIHQGLFLS